MVPDHESTNTPLHPAFGCKSQHLYWIRHSHPSTCITILGVYPSLIPRLTPTFCITGLGASAKSGVSARPQTCNTKSGGKPGNEANIYAHVHVYGGQTVGIRTPIDYSTTTPQVYTCSLTGFASSMSSWLQILVRCTTSWGRAWASRWHADISDNLYKDTVGPHLNTRMQSMRMRIFFPIRNYWILNYSITYVGTSPGGSKMQ